MIRSSFSRLATSCHYRQRGIGHVRRSAAAAAGGTCNLHQHQHFLSTQANLAHSTSSSDEKAVRPKKPKKKKFFDEVDELMARNSPVQYQRFLESKSASESWRAMQQRNELSRRRLEREQKSKERAGIGEDEVFSSSSNTIDTALQETTPPISSGIFADREADTTTSNYDYGGTTTTEHDTSSISTVLSLLKEMNVGEPTTPTAPTTKLEPESETEETTNTLSSISEETKAAPVAEVEVEDETPKKKGGIFSSISKSALSFQNDDNKNSTSIPLSELFPTLYANQNKKEETSTAPKKKPINPAMMYNSDHFEAYEEAMNAIFDNDRGVAKFIAKFEKNGDNELGKRNVQVVKQWLMSNQRIVDADEVGKRWDTIEELWKSENWMAGASSNDEAGESKFHLELKAQREAFLTKLVQNEEIFPKAQDSSPESEDGSSESSQPLTEQEMNPSFHEVASHIMAALGRYCARRARSSPMEVAWLKVKESGLLLGGDVISTYLYVVSTMGMTDSIGIGRNIGLGSTFSFSDKKNDSTESEANENKFVIPEEVSTYHDLCSKPTENSISLRIKSMASKGDAKSAEELLDAFKKSIDEDENSKELIRLRTYLPILKQYCEENDISSALKTFKRMQTTNGVFLEPETYVLLLAAMAEKKYFCDNSSPIGGAQDAGYKHSHGAKLFDELASEMAEDALEISSSSARRLSNALAIGFKDFEPESETTSKEMVVSTLKEVHPLMSMPLTSKSANENELVACRVSLDRATGICPVTQAQQRLIVLEPDQRKQLHGNLLDVSIEQYANFQHKRANDKPEMAKEKLQHFSNWLDKREGKPFTAIVDGANVGYYMQSFDKGRFNWYQIKFMVDTLEEQGETPLVVIPNKYGYNEFYSAQRKHQRLDQAEIEIMNDLRESGKLYQVPPRCLDDFYWMLASVSDQTASRKGEDLSVPSDDPDGRFPGTRPMLVTNDQMRDHKLELLEPRLFRRWYGCHIVNYNFTAFVMGESVRDNEVFFSPADFFSREIQGNECPISDKEGGASEWAGNHAWHFPVNDWPLDERFVVRIPTKTQK